jgi:hypothetical protein
MLRNTSVSIIKHQEIGFITEEDVILVEDRSSMSRSDRASYFEQIFEEGIDTSTETGQFSDPFSTIHIDDTS